MRLKLLLALALLSFSFNVKADIAVTLGAVLAAEVPAASPDVRPTACPRGQTKVTSNYCSAAVATAVSNEVTGTPGTVGAICSTLCRVNDWVPTPACPAGSSLLNNDIFLGCSPAIGGPEFRASIPFEVPCPQIATARGIEGRKAAATACCLANYDSDDICSEGAFGPGTSRPGSVTRKFPGENGKSENPICCTNPIIVVGPPRPTPPVVTTAPPPTAGTTYVGNCACLCSGNLEFLDVSSTCEVVAPAGATQASLTNLCRTQCMANAVANVPDGCKREGRPVLVTTCTPSALVVKPAARAPMSTPR